VVEKKLATVLGSPAFGAVAVDKDLIGGKYRAEMKFTYSKVSGLGVHIIPFVPAR
jgi:hypothetical protein